jgi:hypothetical protein
MILLKGKKVVNFIDFDFQCSLPEYNIISDWNIINGVVGFMTKEECKYLLTLVSEVDSCTEIGTFHGRSAVAIALGLRYGGRLQLVDIGFGDCFLHTYNWIKKRRPDLAIITANCSSIHASQVLYDSDIVFIDADHSYEGVMSDVFAWKNKCKILCGHDYYEDINIHPGVKKAIDELFPNAERPVESIWLVRNPI